MEKKKAPMSLTGLIVLIICIATIVASFIYFFQNYDLQIMNKKGENELIKAENKEEIYETKIEELDKDIENTINLKLGKFYTNKTFDPSEGEGIVNINLKENKQFEIKGSYGGIVYIGIYEVVDSKLICSAQKKIIEEGGTSEKNVNDVFEFAIINENEINFEKCKNDSKIFELSKDISYYINKDFILSLGEYTVDEVKYDEAGVSNAGCGITLKENYEFKIYMGWGAWFTGTYEIMENKLICKAVVYEWDGGPGAGNRATDVVFTYKILNDNKVQLSNINDNDLEYQNNFYEEALSIGMTYSIK